MKQFLTASVLLVGFMSSTACAGSSSGNSSKLMDQVDISKVDAQMDCSMTHGLVGKSFELKTLAHGVSGKVTILDDCTIGFDQFNYDGKGLKVEVYGFLETENEGLSLSIDLLRPNKPYINESLKLRLPNGITFDQFDRLSIWCTEAGVSFGETNLTIEM